MPIRVHCSSCGENYSLADSLLGKKVKCRGCGEPILVEPEEASGQDKAIQTKPRSVMPPRRLRDEDDEDRPRRRPIEDDEGDALRSRRRQRDKEDDAEPRRSRGRDEDDNDAGGAPWGWILGGGAAAAAVLGGLVLVLVLSSGGGDEPKKIEPVVQVDPKIDPGKLDPGKLDPGKIDPGKKDLDPFPKNDRPPKKDLPKKDPLKKFPDPKDKVEVVPWAVAADPGPEVQSPKNPATALTFLGNPHIVFPSTPSPFVAVRHGQGGNEGWQVFNLETGQQTGQIVGRIDLHKEALSPDGNFLAGKGKGADIKQAVINVHSVADKGKIVRTFTMDDAFSLRWLDFLDEGCLVTYKTQGLTAIFQVWNADGRPAHQFNLNGLLEERAAMCLSPGRKFLAVADHDAIHIYHASQGKKVGVLRPPIGFPHQTAMAFSPDGQQLAIYGTMSGSSSRLAVYKMDKGELALDHKFAKDVGTLVKFSIGYKGQPLEWLPDKSGWLLFGQAIIDYESGAPVHNIAWPEKEFSYFPRRFIGQHHIVSSSKGFGVQGTRMEFQALPSDKIAQAIKQARAGGGSAASELPVAKSGDLAGAITLPNPGGNIPWKVEPDPAKKPKGQIGRQPITLRGQPETILQAYFTSPEVGQAAVLDAFQPNPLANRRQYRIDRFDLVKGDRVGTTDLFAVDAPAKVIPGMVGPGGPIKATPFYATDVSPGGTRFAACRVKDPHRLDVWNLAEGKHLVAWKPFADKVEWCGFVDEERLLTLGGGKLILWKLPELKAEYIVEGYKGVPQFSTNRKLLLVVNGAVLELIEPATGQRLGQLESPAGLTMTRLQAAAFSPDGKELVALVTAARGGRIVRWDLTGGACKDSMEVTLGALNAGVQWAGPKHVLVGALLYNWELKAATVQYPASNLGSTGAASPDGRHWFAAAAGKDGAVLSAQSLPDPAAAQLGQLISAGQVRVAIPPGTNFQIALAGYRTMQNEIHTSLTDNFKNIGFKPGPGGVTVSISAQEMGTGKVLDYEIRKLGFAGLPMGGKQMVKIGEKKVVCQVTITEAAGTILEKRDASFETPGNITFEGDNYQQELDRGMWNSAVSFARSVMLPTNLYRVQGQLMTLPRPSNLKAGG